jgi:glycerate-2-kinase
VNDLKETNSLLIRSGAPIAAINTVRKHLSHIKGGKLTEKIHPRHLWTLIISDIPGDRLDLVASGPTLPDPSTFRDAAHVLDEFRLRDQIPKRVHQRIEAGLSGQIDETLKPTHTAFQHVVNYLIGSNRDACEAVLATAKQLRFNAKILTTECQGEAREVGAKIGRLAQQLSKEVKDAPMLIIIGSETTVTVRHQGKGGRNSELVAAAMKFLADHENLVIASLATDGIDGPTEFAGAIADGTSFRQAQTLKCPPKDAIATNTTYNLFQILNDHILTGSTGSNVRDITLILVTKSNPLDHST